MCSAPERNAIVRYPRKRGFTLIEVIVALVILVILSGTIFAIVDQSVRATVDLEIVEREDRRIERFLRLVEETIAALPAGGSLEIRLVEQDPMMQELIVRGMPHGFALGHDPTQMGETTIAIRRREAGDGETPLGGPEYFIGMTKSNFFPNVDPELREAMRENLTLNPDEKGRHWLELVPKVRRMEWRFWDAGKKRWYEKRPASRPPMVELLLWPYDGELPIRVVFDVP